MKSIKLKNDILLESVFPKLDTYNDTAGDSFCNMMKNKIDYCIQNIKLKTNGMTFINGGYRGHQFGLGLFSKSQISGNNYYYQLVWFTHNRICYCNKNGNDYSYKKIDFGNMTD